MCALGDSAGSAAVAYSLAYYNAGSYFDNVELLSGPVLSDIEQGCQVCRISAEPVAGRMRTDQLRRGPVRCQLGGGPNLDAESLVYVGRRPNRGWEVDE